MKHKFSSMGRVTIALVLALSLGLVMAPVAVSAAGPATFEGSTIEVTSLAVPRVPPLDEDDFNAEPETLVVDAVAFDAQSGSQVVIEGEVSALDLGLGWVDTAYVEIGLRPEATMDARNAGIYLIAYSNAPAVADDTVIHLQDYTGMGLSEGVINIPKDSDFRYKITLNPSVDTGGTATLEVWVGEVPQGTVSGFDYGYESDWQERSTPDAPPPPALALNEDFSEAHLFYSIIADRRGVADVTYSATVGNITIDDNLYVGVEQPFSTIFEAIDFANPGDTISVEAGTYVENVIVDKALTLQGAEGATIAPTTDCGVEIQASDITVDGFNITTLGLDAHGIYISVGATGLTLTGNDITIGGGSTAIYADAGQFQSAKSSGWVISGNTLNAPAGCNLELYDVDNVTVDDNIFGNTAGSNVIVSSELFDLVEPIAFTNNDVQGNDGGSMVAFVTDFQQYITETRPDITVTTMDDVTITGNTFAGWAGWALRFGDWGGPVTNAVVNSNTFNMTTAGEVIGGADAPSATGAGNTFNVSSPATIQDAIDSAFAGDTVNVANGTYSATSSPFVRITTDNLTLIGESRDGVILDGTGTSTIGWAKGIHVTANNATIKNVTVQNFGAPEYWGYGILFRDYDYDTPGEGYIYYTGCLVENVKSQNNCYPMYALVNQNLTIRNCLIQNNLSDGMFIARECDNATITGNTVINSGDHGIWVGKCWTGLGPSDNATITGNIVDGAREGGITFCASDGAIISGNTITNVAGEIYGIGALSLKDGPSNVEAYNNTIYNNDGSWGGYSGTGHGVGIDGTPSNINLYFNNIYGNTGDGCHNYSEVTVMATKNWWGDPSGPDGVIGDPGTYTGVLPGIGDKVSANVKCMPWLTRPFEKVLGDNIAYFGISFPAKEGWNIVSAPLALDAHVDVGGATANTWDGLLNIGKKEGEEYALNLHYTVEKGDEGDWKDYTPIYYYDSDPDSLNKGWRQVTDLTDEINPLDAFYIRMMESDSIPILFSPDFSVPSKKLYQGWNLVGCAYMDVMFGGEGGLALETALATIAEVSSPTGDVTGYDQVVSPPMNQEPWIYIPGTDGGIYTPSTVGGDTILIGKGYWVFMENPGTLAGLTFTPISPPKP